MKVKCPICRREVHHIQLRAGRKIDEFICPTCHDELMAQKSRDNVSVLSRNEIIERIFKDAERQENEK